MTMKGTDLYNLIAITTPVCSAIFMLIMLTWDMMNTKKNYRQPQKWLFVFLLLLTFHELLPVYCYYAPEKFVYMNWLFYLIMYITPVVYYRFIFEITRINTDERFPWQHYIFPVAVSFLIIVMTVVIPHDNQFRILSYCGRHPVDNSFFGIFASIKIPLKLLIELFYLAISFTRLNHYRKFAIEYASNENKSSLRWVYRYLLFILIMALMSTCAVFVTRDTFYSTPLITFPLFILAFLEVNIVYHIIRGDYILLEPEPLIPLCNKDLQENDEQLSDLKKSRLTKAFFEEYMYTKKPFLNPDLKISNLVTDLEMNRTYISGFINREYNMNFSRYINNCRLKEYNLLLADPVMKDKSKEELSELAGFSSYRYFLRLSNEK